MLAIYKGDMGMGPLSGVQNNLADIPEVPAKRMLRR
jgi:hypothetical protein